MPGSSRKLVYLDTNIYNWIADKKVQVGARSLFGALGCKVVASSSNLYEILQIPGPSRRRSVLLSLTTVAAWFERYPASYLHARELLMELRRLRPEWIVNEAFAAKARSFLRTHKQIWEDAKRLVLPDAAAFASYHADAKRGARISKTTQKTEREWMQEKSESVFLGTLSTDGAIHRVCDIRLNDPERSWRIECLGAWHSAIVLRSPSSRDYQDWLGPHLVKDAFLDVESYSRFWLQEAAATSLPRNRLVGLVKHFQVAHKIKVSNAADAIQADKLLDVDVFLTGDRHFANALKHASQLVQGCCPIFLLDGKAVDLLGEIQKSFANVEQP